MSNAIWVGYCAGQSQKLYCNPVQSRPRTDSWWGTGWWYAGYISLRLLLTQSGGMRIGHKNPRSVVGCFRRVDELSYYCLFHHSWENGCDGYWLEVIMGFSSGDFWHRSDICGLPLVRWPVGIPDSEELTGKGHFAIFRVFIVQTKIPTFHFHLEIPLFLGLP